MYAQEKRSDFPIDILGDFNQRDLGWKSSRLPELRSQQELEIDEFRPLNASALRNDLQYLLRTSVFNSAVPVMFLVVLLQALMTD